MIPFFKKFATKKQPKNETVTPKIEYNGATKYAENTTNDAYLDFEELGGFPYLKTIIIGDFSTKIKRTGCKLSFIFENDSLTLNSDNTDIDSTQIKNTSAYFTEIDFELDDHEASKIKNEKVIELKYIFKSKTISFKPVEF